MAIIRKHNKIIYFSTIILFFLIACQRHNIVRTHGIAYLEKRQNLISVNESNKNDVIKIFGQPATEGMTDDNIWIYIERTQTREKILKLGRNYLSKNNVLVLEFNKFGLLSKKEFYYKVLSFGIESSLDELAQWKKGLLCEDVYKLFKEII